MKKGFTLIEIIVVLSIISIILLISFPTVTMFNSLKTKIKMEHAVSSTVEFINGCKSFSRNKGASTTLYRYENNKLSLYLGGKLIKTIELPDEVIYSGFNPTRGYVEFDKFGYTSDSCTISIQNEYKEVRSITIKVGTAYVSEK